MLGTTHPATQHHILDDNSLQKLMLWKPQISQSPPQCSTSEHKHRAYCNSVQFCYYVNCIL